ncbi:MAG: response regulator [Turicibacter sp.]|nr:response regulator [Turicibacter sp.]
MITKEQIMNIDALNNNEVARLKEDEVFDFIDSLNSFCDFIPMCNETLNEAVKNEDSVVLSKTLDTIHETLVKIHAIDLIQECSRMSDDFDKAVKSKTMKYGEFETKLMEFLRTLSEFSIEIQMILHKDDMGGKQAKLDDDGDASKIKDEKPEEQKPKKPATLSSKPSPIDPEQTYNILAVDDTAFFLQILKTHLSNTRYKITCLNSGITALRFLNGGNKVDLFLLDIEMPDMNGYELAESIRKMGRTEPIVFLTGTASRDAVIKAIRSGGTDFILKPCNREQIISRFEKHLVEEDG